MSISFKIHILLIISVLSFSSCKKNPVSSEKIKTKNPIVKNEPPQIDTAQTSVAETPKENKTLSREEKVKQIRADFQYIDAKFKLHYKSEKENTNIKVKLRMKKDSLIWASFTGPVGIEGLRTLITRDSVLIIDRINKEYMASNFDTLSQMLNFKVDFEMLQAIILGNMPLPNYDKNDMSEEGKHLKIRQKARGIEIDNYVNPQNQKLEQLNLKDNKTNNVLNLLYSGFTNYNGNLFPHNSKITVKYTNKDLKTENTNIDINYSEVNFTNEILAFPFSIPEKYRKQ